MKVLSDFVIKEIKKKSGLAFEMAKDYNLLSDMIYSQTSRNISANTLKRVMGHISDVRESTLYTLNTIAIFLGAYSWDDYNRRVANESQIAFADDSVLVRDLAVGSSVVVRYLNRVTRFTVIDHYGVRALKVVSALNSSLMEGDVAVIHKITKGMPLEADAVIRDGDSWNYRTRGEVVEIEVSDGI